MNKEQLDKKLVALENKLIQEMTKKKQ